MRLSSQSLFLLLFVLVARVSLAADLERKDQPLAAPTPTPAATFRFYARDEKKSNDDDDEQITIFQCTTKVIVEVPANGDKGNAVTNEQVKCMPTAVPSAKATATRQNKRVTVTQTSKATPTTASSSSNDENNDGSSSSDGSSSNDGSDTKNESSDDENSDVSAFTESGSTSSSPTGSVEDPNAPATGGDNNGSSLASDSNSSGDSPSSDNTNTDTDDSSSSATNDTENSSNSEDGSSTAAADDDTTTTDGSDDASDSDDSILGGPNDHQDGAPSEDSGAASDPNVRSETQAVEGNVSNKALGIGLGVGIGCVAAIGLAGLLVANKRRRDSQSSSSSSSAMDDPNVDTHWRPQSFMGVVASVVAKLPRSASLRSNRSKRDTAAGMAVGAGQGAIEDPSATLGRHPSNSSSRSAASQPPSLAVVHERPAGPMHEIDLRY
ncbi:hypothetical protein BDB00DRAFT_825043 [Zychaea mexicana]|uniref:uncharacterized protein n=1 Tax=Zychaea mexicana TaxID=64656 RepID=UPI0022FE0B62|nr:uncharacterized protein BDB00DRAFT_825043 [Zychaea mexicana]KAI9493034.1 hypothetical protein BDB00DRAFT_825043 [Zychaea mexicana]